MDSPRGDIHHHGHGFHRPSRSIISAGLPPISSAVQAVGPMFRVNGRRSGN